MRGSERQHEAHRRVPHPPTFAETLALVRCRLAATLASHVDSARLRPQTATCRYPCHLWRGQRAFLIALDGQPSNTTARVSQTRTLPFPRFLCPSPPAPVTGHSLPSTRTGPRRAWVRAVPASTSPPLCQPSSTSNTPPPVPTAHASLLPFPPSNPLPPRLFARPHPPPSFTCTPPSRPLRSSPHPRHHPRTHATPPHPPRIERAQSAYAYGLTTSTHPCPRPLHSAPLTTSPSPRPQLRFPFSINRPPEEDVHAHTAWPSSLHTPSHARARADACERDGCTYARGLDEHRGHTVECGFAHARPRPCAPCELGHRQSGRVHAGDRLSGRSGLPLRRADARR
ncbi:hypothetical protein OF83DRAFT_1160607, partial [Amylostereum chailletii]